MSEETQTTEEVKEPSYYFAEGVAGEGDAPDWFKGDKYKNVSEQAKAYSELLPKYMEKHPTAPDSYEVSAPEGIELDMESPLLSKAQEFAKANNMPQEAFNGLVQMYVDDMAAQQLSNDEFAKEELAKLDNADERIGKIDAFLKAQLPDHYDGISDAITTADGIKAMEALISKMHTSLTAEGEAPKATTQQDIEELMQEKDEKGQVIYRYSKERQELVRRKIEEMVA